jgi:hypothetical protein
VSEEKKNNPMITKAMLQAMDEGKKREDEFFSRHNIEHEQMHNSERSKAYKAWRSAVDHEYACFPPENGRVHLDTPLARKAFILGFNKAQKCPPHQWDRSGERCEKCGTKDWMT